MISRELRQTVFARAKHRCEKCGSRGPFHVHHLTYERKGRELPEDLQLLCLACHGAIHPHHTFLTPREQRKVATTRGEKRERRLKRIRRAGGLEAYHVQLLVDKSLKRKFLEQQKKEFAAEARRLG